jgi:cysteinyl-tRNA synthetase
LRDYFGYDVNFVMNVTDIDDKVCLGVWSLSQPMEARH